MNNKLIIILLLTSCFKIKSAKSERDSYNVSENLKKDSSEVENLDSVSISENLNKDSLGNIEARVLNISKIKYNILSINKDIYLKAKILLIGDRTNEYFDPPNSVYTFDSSVCTKVEELENYKTQNLLNTLTSPLLKNKDVMLEGLDTVNNFQYLFLNIVDIEVNHLIIEKINFERDFAKNIRRIKAETFEISNNSNKTFINYIKGIKAENIIQDNIYVYNNNSNIHNPDIYNSKVEKPYDSSCRLPISIFQKDAEEQYYLSDSNNENNYINFIEEIIVKTLIIRNFVGLGLLCPVKFVKSIEAATFENRNTMKLDISGLPANIRIL